MFALRRPDDAVIRAHLERQARCDFSYANVGETRDDDAPIPDGHRRTGDRFELGAGADAFAAACRAVRGWRMFALPWVELCYPDAPLEVGTTVGIAVRGRPWSLSACRIVYVVDEPRRFGFGYGTLPDHMARGEERFLVEHLADDRVVYDLRAFSRPGHLATRLFWAGMGRVQERFVRGSGRAMQDAARELA